MARGLSAGAIACAALSLAASACAAMPDPFKPPAAVLEPASEAARAAPVLESVIITSNVREAVIDGERVQVGARFRDALVARISDTEVVLRRGNATEVLRLYPEIDKKTARPAEAAALRSPAAKGRP